MRTPWLVALAAVWLLAGEAHAQAYQYAARTVAPATRTGAVTAGSLTWQCTGSECRISGPWPAPGVSACAALAGQVGRIASYGRSGAMLTTEQLAQCNANLPAATLQIDPRVAGQVIRPQAVPPTAVIRPGASSAPASTPSSSATPTPAPATPTSQVAVEPVGAGGDLIVHVLTTPSIQFFGVTPAATAPAPPAPIARIVSGRIDTGGVRLQASAPGATPTARSSATPETPQYARGLRSDVVLRVPVSLRDMPAETFGIEFNCHLFTSRFVPFVSRERTAIDPPGDGPMSAPVAGAEAFYSSGARAANQEVAFGAAWSFIRSIGNYSTTFDIPLQTRPFFRLQDARSYHCDVELRVARTGGMDRHILSVITASGPAGYHPAAGTTPALTIEGNLQ
jgi:hypothetical protein